MKKYTIKQILFGLREVYKENEKELERLKKYVHPDENIKLKEMDLYSYVKKGDGYLQLNIKAQQSLIVQLLESLTNRKVHDDNSKTIEIAHNIKGNHDYVILPKSEIYKVDLEELCKEAYNLLENDFNKNINIRRFEDKENRIDLEANTTGMIIHTGDHGKYPASGIIYNAKSDNILVTPYFQNLFPNEAIEILNIEIPEDKLPEYHRNVIENNNVQDKRVIINGLTMSTSTHFFDIIDTDDTITLLRDRKR